MKIPPWRFKKKKNSFCPDLLRKTMEQFASTDGHKILSVTLNVINDHLMTT